MNKLYNLIENILVPQEKLIEMGESSALKTITDMSIIPTYWNQYAFENPNVQKFIKSTGNHFDVIVAEDFFGDSFLMFAHKYKAPIVTICKNFIIEHVNSPQRNIFGMI